MYNFIIALYATIVRIVSPFNHKAKLMVQGHKDVFKILQESIDRDAKYIWIHAASLGEFEQARPIIERLRSDYPSYKILLTFFSPSGYEVRKHYQQADLVCYLPFDLKRNAKKFIKLANPTIAIFVKYEFWYNYINQLRKNKIPVYMVSAIFRPDQIFFRWYGKSYRRILEFYKCICVQDDNSFKLLKDININQVEVCGDTRFDRVVEIKKESKKLPVVDKFVDQVTTVKPFVLVAGSSWPKDEDVFVEYFNRNKGVKLIIAPHEIHESHLQYIESILKRPSIRYSKATVDNIQFCDCLIIDSFGLLSSLYSYGKIAYVGGGFGVGIHNVLEPAVYGIPVIFGPNFKKFREASQLIEAGGGYSVHDSESFFMIMDEFIQYPEVLSSSGSHAGDYVNQNTGVVDKILKILNLKD